MSLFLPLLIFLAGVGMCLRYSIRDYLTRDSDITWNIAERVMRGEIPDVDFLFFTNLVPSLMQVPFFAAFGFTFFSGIVHAGIINGLAGIAAHVLLRNLGLSLWPAAFYAACTIVVFYPPLSGVYPQAHSYFFAIVAVLGQVLALKREKPRVVTGWYLLSGLMWSFAYLSRPSPACFIVPLAIALLALLPGRLATRAIVGGVLGGLFPVILLVAVVWGLGGSVRDVFFYEFVTPLTLGQSRRILSPLMIFATHSLNLASVVVAMAGAVVVAVRLISTLRTTAWHEFRRDNRTLAWVVGSGLLIAALFFLNTAVQDYFAGAQPIFIIVGCIHAALLPSESTLSRETALPAGGGFGLVLIAVAALDVGWFQVNANAVRGYPTSGTIQAEVIGAADGLPAYAGLRFFTRTDPAGQVMQNADEIRHHYRIYRQAIDQLQKRTDGVFLCFLPQTLYRMADRPSPIPTVGISTAYNGPRRDTADYERLLSLLRRNVERYSVTAILIPITEMSRPGIGDNLSQIACGTRATGDIQIIELCAPQAPRSLDLLMKCAVLAP